jgi:8-amino-7-oxononanoate synthase
MDLFDKTKGLGIVYTLREAQLYPFFRILDESVGNNVVSGGKTLVMMSSNNYLGLTHDPRVIDASVAAIKYWGTGCTGSRFLNGNLSIHEELEKKIAEFFDAEAAIVFASGFLANQGAITAIVDENDHIFSDEAKLMFTNILIWNTSKNYCNQFHLKQANSLSQTVFSA